MFTNMNGMFTHGNSVHDLVIVVAFIGALLSGYAGMTIWARKGGKPGKGFIIGGLLGVIGVLILVLAIPKQAEIDSAARSQGLTPCPHCGNSSSTKRASAGTASATSRLRPQPACCDHPGPL